MKKFVLFAGILLLFALEISKVYFIMPFPGSQKTNTIKLAYWIDKNITWLRILLLLIITMPLLAVFRTGKKRGKIFLGAVIIFYAVVFYLFNFRFLAEKMFYQPGNKLFLSTAKNEVQDDKLVIGVEINGEAKAYPIQLIGYHHQVTDTIGGKPVMVTYCTVCRTGRVFSAMVNGRAENFRLVGMDHFNAMFEDATTKSWWQQATGKAIAGKLTGTTLEEIPSGQMTLAAWSKRHPSTLVMQPDTIYNEQYESLALYDKGTVTSSLEKRDSASWKFKSWVVGVSDGPRSKAYDWNLLLQKQLIEDSLPGLPLLLVLDTDSSSFYTFNRKVDSQVYQFRLDSTRMFLKDLSTGSIWDLSGACINGQLKGAHLSQVQSYQEFWHSWQTFHPATLKY